MPEVAAPDPRRSRELDGDVLIADVERVEGVRVIRTYRTCGKWAGGRGRHGPRFRRVEHDARPLRPGRRPRPRRVRGRRAGRSDGGAHQVARLPLRRRRPRHDLADRAALTLRRAGRPATPLPSPSTSARSRTSGSAARCRRRARRRPSRPCTSASSPSCRPRWRSEGHGVPAKGLTGTGYEGHYFWDTEAYVLPFLIHTSPAVARSLLMHRVRMLPDARRRAREVGCAGALFPWRTINGEEASAYYAAGTAQYHIDADIAYALDQYVRVTGDTDLLFRHGVELLVETARMWAELGFFSRAPRRQVRDPQGDRARRVRNRRRQQPVHQPDGGREPPHRRRRRRAGARRVSVRLPPGGRAHRAHRRRGGELAAGGRADLHPVRRGRPASTSRTTASSTRRRGTSPARRPSTTRCCCTTTRWSSTGTRSSSRPTSCSRRSCCPSGSRAEERRRIFEYYDPLTTGDSSLSECIQAIAAADAGKYRSCRGVPRGRGRGRHGRHRGQPPRRRARRLGRRHLDGRSCTASPGTAGGRADREFAPILPTRARRLRFPLRLRGSVLEVDIEEHQVTYRLRSGEPVTAHHYGHAFTVSTGEPVSFPGQYRTSDAPPAPDGADSETIGPTTEDEPSTAST